MRIGDIVTKRGSNGEGCVVDVRGTWVLVSWMPETVVVPSKLPKICHERELEQVND